MTAYSPIALPSDHSIGACARSRVLDAFSEAEFALFAFLVKNDERVCANAGTAQHLKTLAELPASSRLSKVNQERVKALSIRMKSILSVRADVVHGRMLAVENGSFIFLYPRNATETWPSARLLSLHSLDALANEALAIASELSALIFNPP